MEPHRQSYLKTKLCGSGTSTARHLKEERLLILNQSISSPAPATLMIHLMINIIVLLKLINLSRILDLTVKKLKVEESFKALTPKTLVEDYVKIRDEREI